MNFKKILMMLFLLISIVSSVYCYTQLPDTIASHWGLSGEVDDYSGKAIIFLFPGVMIFMILLFWFIPKIDPLKNNIKSFYSSFETFILVFLLFFLLLQAQFTLWNMGFQIPPNMFMPLLTGFLFFSIGVMLNKTTPNWFIGIRTPWTISNEKVWKKTHDIGSKLFKIAGIISAVGILFQKYAFFFIIVPIIAFSIFLVVYSYFEYKKEIKKD